MSDRVQTTSEVVKQNAQVIWDFCNLRQDLTQCEAMVVLGNNDPRTATHAAELYKQEYAPLIVCSGKEGLETKGKYDKTEAETFRDVLISNEVPSSNIILENLSTNTGENLVFSQKVMSDIGLKPSSLLIVTKPCMERRVLHTFLKQWDTPERVFVCVSSPPIPLLDYPNADVGTLDDVVLYALQTYEKLQYYTELEFQIPVDIPDEVDAAYQQILLECAMDGTISEVDIKLDKEKLVRRTPRAFYSFLNIKTGSGVRLTQSDSDSLD